MSGAGSWYAWVVALGGATVVAVGAVLLLRALLWDRSRGRRRCPRCWYDMTATSGLTCSECGHDARRERRLRRTRRHAGPAALGALLILLGTAVAIWPRARHGWHRVAPTTLLIAMMPDLQRTWPAGYDELARRCDDGTPWSWQWRLLIDRIHGGSFCQVAVATRSSWPQRVPLAATFSASLNRTPRALIDGSALRVRIVPRFDADAPAVVIPDPRWSWQPPSDEPAYLESRRAGLPPRAGEQELEFEVFVERVDRGRRTRSLLQRGAAPGWQVIHETAVDVALDVSGALAAYVTPVGAAPLTRWLRDETVMILDNRALRVAPPPSGSAREDLVLPVEIELLRGEEPVASWLDWWDGREGQPRFHRLPADLTGDRRPFGTADYDAFTWSVRVRGDAARAVLREDAGRFWSGSYRVELALVDTPGELICCWPPPRERTAPGQ